MKYSIKIAAILSGLLFDYLVAGAQVNPVGLKFDEAKLALWPGTSVVSDPTAEGGAAIYRPATAESNTMWYGPYTQFQGGNYLIQVRLKVSSNVSSSFLFQLDVFSQGNSLGVIAIKPSLFRNSNEWQLFSLPVTIPDNLAKVEIRGMLFTGGIADVSLDYINILPGDIRGFFSNELTVTGKGAVGIGTKSPDQMLTVNGGVHAKEVKVDVNIPYPDYVFKPSYQLMSLSNLDAYIKQNHHLPDVPSEQQAMKEGVNLSEMNSKLLKKVEELTLYLIEKEKKEQILEKRVRRLERSKTYITKIK